MLSPSSDDPEIIRAAKKIAQRFKEEYLQRMEN
jgi:hypothetical protein